MSDVVDDGAVATDEALAVEAKQPLWLAAVVRARDLRRFFQRDILYAVSTVPVPGLRKMALAVPEPALEHFLGHGWLGYLPERWRWNR